MTPAARTPEGGYIGAPIPRREDARLLTGRGTFVDDLEMPGVAHAAMVRSPHAHARVRAHRHRRRAGAARRAGGGDGRRHRRHPEAVAGPHAEPGARHHRPPRRAPHAARREGPPRRRGGRGGGGRVARARRGRARPRRGGLRRPARRRHRGGRARPRRPAGLRGAGRQHRGPHRPARRAARAGVRRRRPHAARDLPRDARRQPLDGGPRRGRALRRGARCLHRLGRHPDAARHPRHARLSLRPARAPRARDRAARTSAAASGPRRASIPRRRSSAGWPAACAAPSSGSRIASSTSCPPPRSASRSTRSRSPSRKDGTLLALRDVFTHDIGMYGALVSPVITACTVPGPYRIPNIHSEVRAAYTNLQPTGAVRGAGRPQGVLVMERMMDRMAETLGLDPAEVRFRNLIPADAFPYPVGMWFRDGAPLTYDSGDYPELLRRALELADYAGARREQARLRAEGRYRGIGVAICVEGVGLGPFEGAILRLDAPRARRRDQRRAAAGTGLPDHLRPDRRRRGRRPLRGRRRGDRRHRRHPLRRRQLRQPRHRQCRARHPRGRRRAAREDPRRGRASAGGRGGGPRDRRRRRPRARAARPRRAPRPGRAPRQWRRGLRHGHARRARGRPRGLRVLHAVAGRLLSQRPRLHPRRRPRDRRGRRSSATSSATTAAT